MKGDPVIPVVCDNPDCGMSQSFDMCSLARGGWDDRYLARQLDAAGWETADDGEHYCPECAEDRAAEREATCTTR